MRLRLMTYNIHRAIGVDRRFVPERIIEILRHHDADVVLLQEVDRHAPRSNMLDLASHIARALSYPHRAVGMTVYLKLGRSGNATLSRFPIGRQSNLDLTVLNSKRRGAQHTRIHVPLGGETIDIDLYNVHLGLRQRIRWLQARRLLACPDIARNNGSPCIIAGDTNDWAGILKRTHFRPAGFEIASNRPDSRWSIRTFPSYAPTAGLDKVFFRGPLKLIEAKISRLKVARVASDHLPLLVDFELSKPAARPAVE